MVQKPKRLGFLARLRKQRRLKMDRPKRARRRRWYESAGWAIDSALSVFAPTWAARRMQSRASTEMGRLRLQMLDDRLSSNRGFSGTERPEHRNSRWLNYRRDVDGFLDEGIYDLQTRCEELARNNLVARSAIESRNTHEVGTGLFPQSRIKPVRGFVTKPQAEVINSTIDQIVLRWSMYGVDESRIFTLPMFERIVNRSYATYGEAFILHGQAPYMGPIGCAMELVHPTRVETPPEEYSNPNVRLGVKYDSKNRVLGYYVRTRDPDDHKRFEHKYEFYPRWDETGQCRMAHIFDPAFPGQSRGIPWLAAAMNRMKDLDDFWEAELINKQVEACFGLAVTGGSKDKSPYELAEGNSAERNSAGDRIEELSPGTINYFDEDAEIKTIDPQRPGSTFAPFIELSLRSIAGSINMPYELLAKNFFRTTYSSGRLAMIDGRMGFRVRTQTMTDMWLCHVFRRVVHESMFLGLVPIDPLRYRAAPWHYDRHTWRIPAAGTLDPEKQNKSHEIGLATEIETKAGIASDRGENWEDNEEQLLAEAKSKVDREVEVAAYRRQKEEAAGLDPGESQPVMAGAPTPQAGEKSDTETETK